MAFILEQRYAAGAVGAIKVKAAAIVEMVLMVTGMASGMEALVGMQASTEAGLEIAVGTITNGVLLCLGWPQPVLKPGVILEVVVIILIGGEPMVQPQVMAVATEVAIVMAEKATEHHGR